MQLKLFLVKESDLTADSEEFQILTLPQTSEHGQANSLFHLSFINHKLEIVFAFIFLNYLSKLQGITN